MEHFLEEGDSLTPHMHITTLGKQTWHIYGELRLTSAQSQTSVFFEKKKNKTKKRPTDYHPNRFSSATLPSIKKPT